jgi:hypothetical protein
MVRVECWAYVIFVHRTDRGGQFISYRQLRQWQNAVACQIQNCSTWQQLRSLWLAIEEDRQKHNNQYDDEHYPFLCQNLDKTLGQSLEQAQDYSLIVFSPIQNPKSKIVWSRVNCAIWHDCVCQISSR